MQYTIYHFCGQNLRKPPNISSNFKLDLDNPEKKINLRRFLIVEKQAT